MREWSRPITVAEIARQCGCSEAYAREILADAQRRGLVTSVDSEHASELGLIPERAQQGVRCYKLTPDNWAKAPRPKLTARDILGGAP